MRKYHPKNERMKHQYFAYLEEAKRLSVKSVDIAAAAIADFENSTNYKDFAAFHIEQARKYKRVLSESLNFRTKKPLAKATIHFRLLAIKAFFFWLAGQPGHKSKISYFDCEYFNPSANDSRIATAKRPVAFPTLAQVKQTIASMPFETDIEMRNRALLAFTLLTCARVDALISFKISNLDLEKRLVFQDARNVNTKFRKSVQTTFFPVGEKIELIIKDWIDHLINRLQFQADDPLFPCTLIEQDENQNFAPQGLKKQHWQCTSPVRDIFKAAYSIAGLQYFHPHTIRHTIGQLGEKMCQTPEEFKAWSQNMSHESMLTTYTSYGKVAVNRQAEIIVELSERTEDQTNLGSNPSQKQINWVLEHLRKANS